jgi:hypothetical protein
MLVHAIKTGHKWDPARFSQLCSLGSIGTRTREGNKGAPLNAELTIDALTALLLIISACSLRALEGGRRKFRLAASERPDSASFREFSRRTQQTEHFRKQPNSRSCGSEVQSSVVRKAIGKRAHRSNEVF